MADLKERFANWLIEKASPGYSAYFGNIDQALNSLNEYNSFFEIDLFDERNVDEIKNVLNDTFKDPSFEKTSFGRYSKKKQNHVPRAVLWNQNYFKFLNEVKKMGRMIKSTKKSLREINIEANMDKIKRYLNSEKERIVDFINLNGVRTQIVVDGDFLEILGIKHKIKVKYNFIQDKILYSIDLVPHNFSRDMKDWDDEKLIYTVNAQRKEWNPIEKKYLEEFGFQFPYSDKRTILFDISGELTEEDLKKSYMKFVKILIAKSIARGVLAIDHFKTIFEGKEPLNIILYGPPGTGKTYNTVNKALEIVDGKKYESRKEAQDRFCELKEFGQIDFITFHQSFSYEDFVEGIKPLKPEKDDKTVLYDIKDGVFKEMCLKAKGEFENKKQYLFDMDKTNVWKMSLGDTLANESFVFDYCLKNDVILLGYGSFIDYSSYPNERKAFVSKMISAYNDLSEKDYDVTAVHTFKNRLRVGDIVVVSKGNYKIAGIAKVTGDYSYIDKEELDDYVQSRSVEWLYVSEDGIPYDKLLSRRFAQMTIYSLKSNIKIKELKNFLSKESGKSKFLNKNHVLIIDEINRGNVASIFGELITLIEKDKRLGAEHEMRAKLPYSGEDFGVPANLHIIGTMNTADRSVEALDAALRRRFQFEEMMPQPELFNEDRWKWKDFNIKELLTTLNKRLEVLLDRDHQIGHSCFMVPEKDRTEKMLQEIFEYKIIPQLREFFFGDPEKMRLVLGNDFFKKESEKINQFFDVKDLSEYLDDVEQRWILVKSEKWTFESLLKDIKKEDAESDN